MMAEDWFMTYQDRPQRGGKSNEYRTEVLRRFKELALIREKISELHQVPGIETGRILCPECSKPHPCPTLRLTRGEGLGSPDQV